MPVTQPNKAYQDCTYKWKLVRHCCDGSEAVKNARRVDNSSSTVLGSEAGTLYLPAPNAADNSNENRERYKAYLMRANYVNFTGHTKDALMGMVCRRDPIIEMPDAIDGIKYDANGEGESLYSLIKRSIDEVLKTGRQGVLVDYPTVEPGLTAAQTENISPYFKCYCAESIINWKTKTVNGKSVICMVVLKEQVEVPLDEFSSDEQDQYRVLMLTEEGYYVQRLYNQDGELLVDTDGNPDIVPRRADGSLWTEIPFVFLGSVNNDPTPDKSPLYDMAEINISHYRNSADYEESCFLVGQPTPVVAGLTQSWVKDVLKDGLQIGSRGVIPLPQGGSATLLQANPNQMPSEGMEKKEAQMIKIGAKIITDQKGAETAEAAKIRFAGQNSKLGTIVGNVEEAYEKCLEWCVEFSGGTGEVSVELNKEFYEKTTDPQLLMAKIQLLDRGVIAVSDVRKHLRLSGDIDNEREDSDIDDEIAETDPIALPGSGQQTLEQESDDRE